MTRQFRTYAQVAEPAGAEIPEQIAAQVERLQARLEHIRNVIVVASGKGGVGKSFLTTHLAALLAAKGKSIGVLDADLNGPSLAHMLRARRESLRVDEDGVHPVPGRNGCHIMSVDLLLNAKDAPLRWNAARGLEFLQQSVLETGAVRELVSDVAWGELDALLIDLPPGTDKIARLAGLLPRISMMLIVTTPSRVTESVVARSLVEARDLGIANVGLVMNMDSFVCPCCHASTNLFGAAAGADITSDIWARIPFEPSASAATDEGDELRPDSTTAQALAALVHRVEQVMS
jgi:ATP-binding protein involved in chromosome partitioning